MKKILAVLTILLASSVFAAEVGHRIPRYWSEQAYTDNTHLYGVGVIARDNITLNGVTITEWPAGEGTSDYEDLSNRPTLGGAPISGAMLNDPANYPVLNQNTTGSAASVPWSGVTGKPTIPDNTGIITSVLAGDGAGGFRPAAAGIDYLAPTGSGADLSAVPDNAALYPTLNQNTTGTAGGLADNGASLGIPTAVQNALDGKQGVTTTLSDIADGSLASPIVFEDDVPLKVGTDSDFHLFFNAATDKFVLGLDNGSAPYTFSKTGTFEAKEVIADQFSSNCNPALGECVENTFNGTVPPDPVAGDCYTDNNAGTMRKACWNGSTWDYIGGTGGGITDVVQDTTPQLGGNLDMNTHNIQTVTPTEMAYVHGVTSAIQTQLDAKSGKVVSGTSSLGTSSISSGACATVVTTSASGAATTDVINWGFNGDPTGVTGYAPSVNGMLTIIAYPSANNVNFKVCNNTSAAVTPGAITLNWIVVR